MGNCTEPYVHWIDRAFGQCVSGTRQEIGFALGLASTIIWMWAQLPQIWMNFKRQSTEGLSFAFLCLLVVGDLCNLTGALINGGLMTQVITACWFVFVDCLCACQYIYYVWIRKSCRKRDLVVVDDVADVRIPAVPLLIASASAASSAVEQKVQLRASPYEPPYLYGTLLGWASACAYACSRTPQIIKNCRRKKTEGLSVQFFISAVLGNGTYAASIFLADPHWPYIWSQFPWLVGSAGLLFFDFTVLGQFLYYGAEEEKRDHDGEDVSLMTADMD